MTWIEAAYAPNVDTTFIVQYEQDDNGLIFRETVVGFYHGEPEERWTEYYQDKGVTCECEI